MIAANQAQNRYTRFSTKSSEEFNTASRSVKPGLIASGIVSAWTWAATLLQSSTVAYTYGVAGPFWVQIPPLRSLRSRLTCFSMLQEPQCKFVKLTCLPQKRHTDSEIVK